MIAGAGVLFTVGCGPLPPGPSPTADGGAPAPVMEPFVAGADTFAPFRTWTSFALEGAPAIDSGLHTMGMRTIYINALPAHGARAFPVGTVIVKVIQPNPQFPTGTKTFAMAKRGGGFNDSGARGWEFFELDTTVHPPGILWAGTGPPVGDTYNGEGSCNSCHVLAAQNDSVHSPPLLLSSF